MQEDRTLVLECKRGNRDAMQEIYEEYSDSLVTIAKALLNNDKATAEDMVHDVFVSFAQSVRNFQLKGTLRGYLATCVMNLARDKIRAEKHHPDNLEYVRPIASAINDSQQQVIEKEESMRLRWALSQLPYKQREIILLHLKGQMKFRTIAELQQVSVNTVQGRYRYGLDKLRSLLDSEVTK